MSMSLFVTHEVYAALTIRLVRIPRKKVRSQIVVPRSISQATSKGAVHGRSKILDLLPLLLRLLARCIHQMSPSLAILLLASSLRLQYSRF